MNTASLKQDYKQRIVPALKEKFGYSTVMQVPVLEKIVINQGLGEAVADKKVIEIAINELTAIAGQKAVQTLSKKDQTLLLEAADQCMSTSREYVGVGEKIL